MLGVTGLQVLCSIGVMYFGTRTGTGFGRDLRGAMFEHVITFSEPGDRPVRRGDLTDPAAPMTSARSCSWFRWPPPCW